jgi:hypothetical protein
MRIAWIAALAAAAAAAQTKTITELKLRVDPAEARVRPLESLVVQVLVYGSVGEKQGRLQSAEWQIQVRGEGNGWLSKTFRFQGEDREAFLEERQNALLNIFNRGVGQFTVKDAVLYTAPEREGKYTVEVTSGSLRAETTIEVTNAAPSRKKPEKTSFERQPPAADPYRKLAERWSPFIAQETWFQPKADFLARFDYDGDWQGDNNWDRLDDGTSQAYVHYAAMETATHWFLIYNFFHPRDYSDNCVVGTCHENDNEGMILTIRKDGSEFGKLEVMETLAHNNIYSYTNERSIRGGLHNPDGGIELWEGSHPMVFLEAGGHGAYGATDSHSLFSPETKEFQRTGVTYVYRGEAQRPKHPQDRLVGYDLLPIWEEWWKKSALGVDWAARTFDDFFLYEPYGGRPRMQNNRVGGSFYGRVHGENKAKPFWGWHDTRTWKAKALNRGQWGLDPAYAVSQNLRFPPDRPVSLEYIFNPYLDVAAPTTTAAPPPPRARPSPAAETAREGSCEIEARVDGSAVVTVQGDQGSWQELSGQPASDTTLRCTAGLPAEGVEVEVEKRGGRGSVRLLEAPSAANGFAAKVQVDDPRGGADRYRIRIRWRAGR